ncbi:hypothetical protein NMY22_g10648 [Coprinellus aureogranulatus]|nr:hypothetical protein NMY22_g10648 [Coprinellus aureogranulatus]
MLRAMAPDNGACRISRRRDFSSPSLPKVKDIDVPRSNVKAKPLPPLSSLQAPTKLVPVRTNIETASTSRGAYGAMRVEPREAIETWPFGDEAFGVAGVKARIEFQSLRDAITSTLSVTPPIDSTPRVYMRVRGAYSAISTFREAYGNTGVTCLGRRDKPVGCGEDSPLNPSISLNFRVRLPPSPSPIHAAPHSSFDHPHPGQHTVPLHKVVEVRRGHCWVFGAACFVLWHRRWVNAGA